MTLIWNEQTKLLANALDRASTACLSVCVLSWTLNAVHEAEAGAAAKHIAGAIIWLLTAFSLHFSARIVLGKLR